jgi:hypothetical protein
LTLVCPWGQRACFVSQSMMKVDEIAGLSLTPGLEPPPYSVRVRRDN